MQLSKLSKLMGCVYIYSASEAFLQGVAGAGRNWGILPFHPKRLSMNWLKPWIFS